MLHKAHHDDGDSCLIQCLCLRLQESALSGLMAFAAAEGQHPLEDLDWSGHYSFPRELVLVGLVVSCDLPVGEQSLRHLTPPS